MSIINNRIIIICFHLDNSKIVRAQSNALFSYDYHTLYIPLINQPHFQEYRINNSKNFESIILIDNTWFIYKLSLIRLSIIETLHNVYSLILNQL